MTATLPGRGRAWSTVLRAERRPELSDQVLVAKRMEERHPKVLTGGRSVESEGEALEAARRSSRAV